MVKNPPCNAEDGSSMPNRGTKIALASEELSPRASTRESAHYNKKCTRCNKGTQ